MLDKKQPRSIKFRAWCAEMGSMRYSDKENDGTLYMFFGNSDDECCNLMQFTGLLDKRGKEIYEGDVLRFAPEEWGNDQTNLSVVMWNKEGCCFRANGAPSDWAVWCEVVGNIYENPELIEV